MRRNTISEGVAAPLPGNRLSALPTNTQLDTAQEHPTNNPTTEQKDTRTLNRTRILKDQFTAVPHLSYMVELCTRALA